MRLNWVSGVLLGWLLCGDALAQPIWHDLRLSPVSVAFPQKPRLKVTQDSSPIGPVTSKNYEFQGEKYHLVLSSTQLPSLAVTFRGADGLYEDASEALLKQYPQSQRVSFAPASVAGRNGAELNFTVNGQEQGLARFVLLGEQLLVAQAIWQNSASSKDSLRFLNSLRLQP